MKEVIIDILRYLLEVLISTISQILILLGPLLVLALIMNLVARLNEKYSYKVFGTKGFLYVFGWLGTAVHELGHAVFAIIFGHKITDITLFSTNDNGSLGHVVHTYNQGSIYQNIGNFFIGIGPIIFGSLVLFLISWLLFDVNFKYFNGLQINSDELLDLSSLKSLGIQAWEIFEHFMEIILYGENSIWWKVLIFIYLLYSVGSSITLSKADVSGAMQGFVFFVIVLVIFNLATIWIGEFTKDAFSVASNYLSSLYFLIIMSIFINIIFSGILFILYLFKKLIF